MNVNNINASFKNLIKVLILAAFCSVGICFASSQLLPLTGKTYQPKGNSKNKIAGILHSKLNNNFLSNFIANSDEKDEEKVGSLSGKLEVTPTGAASYDIPLTVPPGTAGMTPKLSIQYNSQQKNGPLGMGFSLQGLTSIVRTPQNKMQNGKIHGVDFTDEDRFALDGQQLIAVKGDYAQDQTEYRTYIDSQAKVVSYNRQGKGPQSFKVWTKGGQIAEYGVSDDSRLKAYTTDPQKHVLDDQTVKIWALNKIQDTVGNYLQVHYFKDEANGAFYPAEIDYTGNAAAGIKPYNKIEFIYSDRSDVRTLWQAGSKSTLNKLLTDIKIYSGDQNGNYKLVYDYHLNYEISPNSFRSRLTSIQLSDANGKSYPATTFNWQTNDEGWEEVDNYKPPVSIVGDDKDNGVRLADLTGNGLPDFIEGHIGELRTWLNTGSGWHEDAAYKPPVAITSDGKDDGVRLVDLTGNGLPDFMEGHVGELRTWLNAGIGWHEDAAYKPPVAITSDGKDDGVRLVNLIGNGLPDFIEGHNGELRMWLNTAKGWHEDVTYKPPVSFVDDGKDLGVRVTDVTGSCLSDFMEGHTGELRTWLNTGSSWHEDAAYKPPVAITSDGVDDGVRLVDLTGNGLSDFMEGHIGELRTWLNTGSGWHEGVAYRPPVAITSDGKDDGVRLVDLTGNGLPDFIEGHIGELRTWLNTGSGWHEDVAYRPPVAITSDGVDDGVRLIDLTGNGLPDFMEGHNSELRSWLNRAKKLPDMLIGITNGFGEKTSIDYEPLSGTYVKVYNQEKDAEGKLISQYPNPQIDMPMYIVYQTSSDTAASDPKTLSKLKQTNGAGKYDSLQSPYSTIPNNQNGDQHITTYHYTGARVNKLGWGFLGFHKIDITDNTTGIKKVTTYSQDGNAHTAHMPVEDATYSNKGVMLSDIVNTYQVKQFGDGTLNKTYYLPYVSTSVKKNYDLKDGRLLSTVTTETNLDDYANPTEIKTTTVDETGSYVTNTINTYVNNIDNWFIGELINSKVTTSAPNTDSITRESSFTYDTANGMLKTTTTEPNDEKYSVHTSYDRDFFGNIIKTTISGADIDSRQTSATYDAEGRFIVTKTNALGQEVSQTMDPRFGEPLTTTDLNGLVTKYKYDDFGRVYEVDHPDNTVTTTIYSWANHTNQSNFNSQLNQLKQSELTNYEMLQAGKINNPKTAIVGYGMQDQPIKAVYSVTTYTTGNAASTTYYDELARKVADTTQGFDGRIIWKDTFYDDLGRVIQQSVPYFTGDSLYYTRFKYDVLGRLIQTTNPDDSVILVDYNGFATTTTNPLGQKTTKIANVRGKIIESIDNEDHHTHFQYDAYGNLLSLTDCKGNISKIQYDKLGRKIAINDLDKGNWSYNYNVLGELISQTNADKNTTTFTYDKLGRLISRTDKGGTSGWIYGNDIRSHNVGKLIEEDGISDLVHGKITNSVTLQLISSQKDGVAGYRKTIEYDDLSRPTIVTTSVNGSSYTTTTNYDSCSRPELIVYPNKLTVQNQYNEYGYLIDVKNISTGTTNWQLNAMDAAGHIISETHGNGLVTTKTYDPRTGFLLNINTKPGSALQMQQKVFPGLTSVKVKKTKAKLQKQLKSKQNEINVNKTVQNNEAIPQQLTYIYDAIGNVKSRINDVISNTDTYSYDDLNRIKSWNSGYTAQQTYKYDKLGNITYKSDLGAYTYGENGAGPHAVTSVSGNVNKTFKYDANGNQIEQIGGKSRKISYTSFDKPNVVKDSASGATMSFAYDVNRNRFSRIYRSKNLTKTIYYLGNYQLEVSNDNGKITQTRKYFIAPDTIYSITDGAGKNQGAHTYTLLKDNLGSVTVITDENGAVLQRFKYDPFGKQILIQGKRYTPPITHHGFTGHEELEEFKLIHMNGRIYDPLLGRFLSADPNIQDPTNSQSLNRYSYCLNNPLAYVDPTGFFSFKHLVHDIGHVIHDIFKNQYVRMALSIVIGSLPGVNWIGIALYEAMFNMVLATAYGGSTHDVLQTGLMTFATAVIWHGTGDFLGEDAPYLERVAVHGLVGGGLQTAEGGNFKDGFLSAAAAEALPIDAIGGENADLTPEIIAERTAAAAIVGGTVASATGGNFANGAKTAAFAELFNDCAVHNGAMWHKLLGSVEKIAGYGLMAIGGIEDIAGVLGAPETLGLSLGLDVDGTEKITAGRLLVEAGKAEEANVGSHGTPRQARIKSKRGQSPKEIKRIDRPDNQPGSQWHVHGENDGAINQDGTIRHRDPGFGRKTLNWLRGYGWNV